MGATHRHLPPVRTMSSYFLLAAVATAVLPYPTGPPNCDSDPNHSGGKGDEIVLTVQDIGDGAWNVSIIDGKTTYFTSKNMPIQTTHHREEFLGSIFFNFPHNFCE